MEERKVKKQISKAYVCTYHCQNIMMGLPQQPEYKSQEAVNNITHLTNISTTSSLQTQMVELYQQL